MKTCDHHYESIKRNIQTLDKQYTYSNKYDYTILSHEEVYIFCRKCGENKMINEAYDLITLESE